MRLSERAEKQVDRVMASALASKRRDAERPVHHLQFLVRRNHVDVIATNVRRFEHLLHRHLRGRLQQLVEFRLVRGRQVQDDDVRHPARRTCDLEEGNERFQAARRRAYADDGEIEVAARP